MSAPQSVLERQHTDAATLSSVEWPTVVLIVLAYSAWIVLTSAYGEWPTWLVAPCVAVLLTLHSSLQHEILHGHPTRSTAINRLLGIVPLSLWIPYDRYRRSHLVHHINDRLTDPLDDPESNYLPSELWQRRTTIGRWWVQAQLTLAGRMLIGSWFRMAQFLGHEARAFLGNEPGARTAWITHLVLCVPVVYWVTVNCGIPMWLYVATMVVPGNAILLIRSFAEHRAHASTPRRTAIVENAWVLGPLFLFNNLHALHHEEPQLPWYRYNSRYKATRARLIAENGGLVYSTYFEVARRYLFTMHDQPQHPLGRVPGSLR